MENHKFGGLGNYTHYELSEAVFCKKEIFPNTKIRVFKTLI